MSEYMAKLWLDEWCSDHEISLPADAYDELLEALATANRGEGA